MSYLTRLRLFVASTASLFFFISCQTSGSGVPGKDVISDDNPAGESIIRNVSPDETVKKPTGPAK